VLGYFRSVSDVYGSQGWMPDVRLFSIEFLGFPPLLSTPASFACRGPVRKDGAPFFVTLRALPNAKITTWGEMGHPATNRTIPNDSIKKAPAKPGLNL
jgi:hypothetical protein